MCGKLLVSSCLSASSGKGKHEFRNTLFAEPRCVVVLSTQSQCNALMLLMLILMIMIMIPGNDTASAVEQSSTSNSRKRETCSMLSLNESVKEEEFGMSISE